ncbi:hypothetical protein [[Limnothrix rosea] IAM M-220]|nr:hypothetical protein [[Limnothrix rosea] IAM M-220]
MLRYFCDVGAEKKRRSPSLETRDELAIAPPWQIYLNVWEGI